MKIACFPIYLLVSVLYVLTMPALADSTTEARIESIKEQTQLRIDSLKDAQQRDQQLLQQQVANQDKQIATQSARIGDLSFYLALYGLVATLLGIGVAIAAIYTAGQKARKEAQEEAERWFNKHAEDLQKRIQDLNAELNEHASKAHQTIDDQSRAVRAQAEESMKAMEVAMYSGKQVDSSKVDSAAIEAIDLELQSKAETEYSYSDWNTRAFAAYSRDDFDQAVSFWGKAAKAQGVLRGEAAHALFNIGITSYSFGKIEKAIATYNQIIILLGEASEPVQLKLLAQAFINQGVALGQIGRAEEEIAAYEQIIARLGNTTVPFLREQIGKALVNQGNALVRAGRPEEATAVYNQIIFRFGNASEFTQREVLAKALLNLGLIFAHAGKFEEAIAAFDQVATRFGMASESALQVQVAAAIASKGFALLAQAKAQWDQTDARMERLETTLTLFQQALESAKDKWQVLGNIAYVLWLLGQAEKARVSLREALEGGGERLRVTELADTELHPVPPDVGFRDLIQTLWGEIKGQPQATVV